MKKLLIGIGSLFTILIFGGISAWVFIPKATIANPTENITEKNRAKIVFSKAVSQKSVEENVFLEPKNLDGEFSWEDNKTLVFDLDNPEEIENFSLSFSGKIKDVWGRKIQSPKKIDFFVPKKDAELVLTTPKNESTDIKGKTPITFLWSRSVLPLQRPDESQKMLNEKITITPQIEGSWSQLGSTGVIFEPKEPWAESTRYEISIPKDLINDEKIDHAFETTRLKLTGINSNDLIFKKPFTARFNQEVKLEEISKNYTVNIPENNNRIPYSGGIDTVFDLSFQESKTNDPETDEEKFELNKKAIVFTPRQDWPADTTFEFILRAETSPATGNIATTEDQKKEFKTISNFRVLNAEKIKNGNLRFRPSDVYDNYSVSFSHPVKSADFAKHLKIFPEPDKKTWEKYIEQWTNDEDKDDERSYFYLNPIDTNWMPKENYTVVVQEGLQDIYGRELKEEFKDSFTTLFPNRLSKIYMPSYNNDVFAPDSQFVFAFTHSGKAREIRFKLTDYQTIETSDKGVLSPNNRNKVYEKIIGLEENQGSEELLEFDLKKEFPEVFIENELPVGKYKIEVYTEDNNRSPAYQSTFYTSDFAVMIKDFANDKYQISATEFDGTEIKSDNVKYSSNKKALPLPTTIKYISSSYITLELPDGRKGIGSTNFDNKMRTWDLANISYSPSEYYHNYRSVLFTDRPLYRPGDTVFVKSVYRELQNFGKNFPLKDLSQNEEIGYKIKIRNPYYDEVFNNEGTTKIGEIDGKWELPEDAPLGQYQMEISLKRKNDDNEFRSSSTFHVKKFHKSNFLNNLTFDKDKAILNENITANISAEYAFGGGLSGKKVNYTVSLFGKGKNCWWYCPKSDKVLSRGEGILDEMGVLQVPINLNLEDNEDKEKTDVNWNLITVNATIQASDSEISSVEKSIPFYNSERIITLNRDYNRYFYEQNKEVVKKGVITDLEKNPLQQDVQIELWKENWVRNDRKGADGDFYGDWIREDVKAWAKTVKSNDKGEFEIKFTSPKESNRYYVKFIATDDKDRTTSTESYFWISGRDSKSIRKNDQNRILSLYTNKDEYELKEEVEIFFPLPNFKIKQAYATLERGEILEEFDVDLKNNTIKFNTEKWMAPNVYVSVVVTGTDEENNKEVRWGVVKVPIKDSAHKLELSVEPVQKIYKPGDEIELKIKTTSNGEPAKSSVTIAVVDETLLALTSRPSLDMWSSFLAEMPLGVSTSHTLAQYISQKELDEIFEKVAKIKSRLAMKSGGGGGGFAKEDGIGKGGSFKPRGDFRDTAEFVARVETDSAGEATVKFKAPDNLTTWNIWAIGHTANNSFGNTENSVRVTLPLLISEILPNSFQMGDEMQVGLLIRRNALKDKTAKIKVKINLPENFTTKNTEQEIEVSQEARVFFPIKVPVQDFDPKQDFSTIKIGFEIESENGEKDAMVVERKLFPPKVTLSVAEFLRVENGERINIFPDLENSLWSQVVVKVSASVAAKLENLIDVTRKMNYGCAEQRMSNSTSVLLQKDFDKLMKRETGEINLEQLKENRDYIESAFVGGGFGYWKGSDKPSEWVTANVLENAKLWEKFDTPFDKDKLENAANYLHKKMLRVCDNKTNWHCMSDSTRNHAGAIVAQYDKLSVSDLAFLTRHASSLEAKIWWLKAAHTLQNKGEVMPPSSIEFADKAWTEIQNITKVRDRYIFWSEYDRSFYSQDERLTALILEEMLEYEKWEELQHKAARYLAETKSPRLSGNSAMHVLQALQKYAKAKEVDELVAKFVINETSNNKEFAKGKTETLDEVQEFKKDIKSKSFDGLELFSKNDKAFYSDVELHEVFTADKTAPVSKGFFVEKEFYELSDENFENPVTEMIIGKNYLVRLKIVTNSSHRQIAITDFIPSGSEFLDLDFENVDQTLKQYESGNNNNRCWGWCRPVFNHKEFHENYARFFVDYLPTGTHEIKYIVRARLGGAFDVLPTKVEEMYFPEVFSTTAGKRITIDKSAE